MCRRLAGPFTLGTSDGDSNRRLRGKVRAIGQVTRAFRSNCSMVRPNDRRSLDIGARSPRLLRLLLSRSRLAATLIYRNSQRSTTEA